MADTNDLLAAIFDLSGTIHDCRNSATYRPNEKSQLGFAFNALTTRSILLQLHKAHVDAETDVKREEAKAQLNKANQLLASASRKSERREAIAETFETLDGIDPLLPEAVSDQLV